ncbi:hypothetical protein J4219_01955 [Candidatus Woesearchaeota archaeon]|nr:hypothetical protein [Candidatus Woesearchaeota archaeon]
MKKEILKALARAKELERLPDPTNEEIAAIYKDAMEKAGELNKLLEPCWFINDVHKQPAKAVKSTNKPAKKRTSSTSRKRKTHASR